MTLQEKCVQDFQNEVIGIARDIEESAREGKIAEYFDEPLDVKITIGGDLRYQSVEIAVALGGPNIYVDTSEGGVRGYWAGDQYFKRLDRYTLNKIDCYFEEYYTSCR